MRLAGLDGEVAQEALNALPLFLPDQVPSATLIPAAITLSRQLSHAFYDCLYLALAQNCEGLVATADQKLIDAAARAGLHNRVAHFGTIPIA